MRYERVSHGRERGTEDIAGRILLQIIFLQRHLHVSAGDQSLGDERLEVVAHVHQRFGTADLKIRLRRRPMAPLQSVGGERRVEIRRHRADLRERSGLPRAVAVAAVVADSGALLGAGDSLAATP